MWLNEQNLQALVASWKTHPHPYPMIPPSLSGETHIRYDEDGYPSIESDCCGFFSNCCYNRNKDNSTKQCRDKLLRMFSKTRWINIEQRLNDLHLLYKHLPHQKEKKELSHHTLKYLYLYACLQQNKTVIQTIERSITEYNRKNHSEIWFINLESLQFIYNDQYLLHHTAPIFNHSTIKALHELKHPGAALYLARYYRRRINQRPRISMHNRSPLPTGELLCQITHFYGQAIQWGLPMMKSELLEFLLDSKQYDKAIQHYLTCSTTHQHQAALKINSLIASRQEILARFKAPKSLIQPLSATPSLPRALLLSESTHWKLLQKLNPFYFQEKNVIHILSALHPKDKQDCDFMNSLVSSKGHTKDATDTIMIELHDYYRNKRIKCIQSKTKTICNEIIGKLGNSGIHVATANAIRLFSEDDQISLMPFIYHPDEQFDPIIALSPVHPKINLHTLEKYTTLTKDKKFYRIYSNQINDWGKNMYNPCQRIVTKPYTTRNINLSMLQKLIHLRYFGHPDFLDQYRIEAFHDDFLEDIAALPTSKLKLAFSTTNIEELHHVLSPLLQFGDMREEQKTSSESHHEKFSMELTSVKF